MIPVAIRLIILLTLVSVLLAGAVCDALAQDAPTLDVNAFWDRLAHTRELAEHAITQTGDQRAAYINRIAMWWTSVQSIQLADGRVIQVNTGWLSLNQAASDDELRTLAARATALLWFRSAYQGTQLDADAMLATLDRILQDERFQYRRAQPATEAPSNSGDSNGEMAERLRRTPDSSSRAATIPAGLAQVVLVVLGALVVLAFAYALWRTLRVQPAAVDTGEDEDDIPPTSDAAAERAAHARTHQDYRAAIRYLYLASLLYLDEHNIIRFDPALTNTEHVRQLARQSPARLLLTEIVAIFDRVWYGFAPVDEALYRHFRDLIDRLKQIAQVAYEANE